MKKIISKNTEETEKIAKDFLGQILSFPKQATVVALYGNLGAGKTTFTQSLGKHLGIKRKVNSPTFVIMKSYFLPLPRGSAQGARGCFKNLIHIDAYRLKNEKDLENLGWAEIIANPENLVFIEWPENVPKALPKKHHKIKISHTKEGHRSFEIK
ncbi:MAG: tRNA (adenosine(37)-N6)-threonylcarbamoyltransferase complex ATPase subunit type 1 TsaE [Candidatus Nomurabacteria bacterium]|nr:tRNA (adenosine(37)-N6)-threonylcarbamoyltransferase complex ATPase subunit type 1 TsaE [Candidatus Nomurabacteria bacterium]